MKHSLVNVYFSDFFEVQPEAVAAYGAINISLLNDFPLFIDPFLLFNSNKAEYRLLHDELLRYLRFVRDKAASDALGEELLRAWLTFPEVRQTWIGFSLSGNAGRGLGMKFARDLSRNLTTVFSSFGQEQVTKSSHLEKLCLLDEGIGRDKISDFTTNLVKHFLLEYTEHFARSQIPPGLRRRVAVPRAAFNYRTESWETREYELPWHPFVRDYVLLTPKDLLTKIDTWINRADLFHSFGHLATAVPNAQLRAQVNNYFRLQLPKKPKAKDQEKAIDRTLRKFPELLEWYIRFKEDSGKEASSRSDKLVSETVSLMVTRLGEFITQLATDTRFYNRATDTIAEARERVHFLKDVIENKGGHRIFWVGDSPVRKESDVQIMFRLTWFATPSDVTREANDGRGPVDFKISRGAFDISLVEFKLASNSHLRANLQKQVEIYRRASNARHGLKVIVYFTGSEFRALQGLLKELHLEHDRSIILIDARADNKPSGSRAA